MERIPRVLVVDDELYIRTTLAAILQQEGFEALIAEDGEDAVSKATEWRPDLVLSDIIMPVMDGIASAILISRLLPDCKIVLLSGHGIAYDLLRSARERGYEFDVLLKPIPPADLIEHLHNVLRQC